MNDSDLVMFYSTMIIVMIVTKLDACDVMGSRACGQKPEKEDRESDPIKYCVASRVYFECVHKKYRGCENKEKYEMAMESIMKGKSSSSRIELVYAATVSGMSNTFFCPWCPDDASIVPAHLELVPVSRQREKIA